MGTKNTRGFEESFNTRLYGACIATLRAYHLVSRMLYCPTRRIHNIFIAAKTWTNQSACGQKDSRRPSLTLHKGPIKINHPIRTFRSLRPRKLQLPPRLLYLSCNDCVGLVEREGERGHNAHSPLNLMVLLSELRVHRASSLSSGSGCYVLWLVKEFSMDDNLDFSPAGTAHKQCYPSSAGSCNRLWQTVG